MSTSITADNISHDQILTLRGEAYTAGDALMGAICDLALHGAIDLDDYTVLDRGEADRVRSMSRQDAYAECARTINDAQG